MATRSFTRVRTHLDASGVILGRWTGLQNTDLGEPFACPHYGDKCVQVRGTWGSGGTLQVQGCNEATPTNWAVLSDVLGNALTFTADGIKQVMQNTMWIRVAVTGGDGSTNLEVTLLAATSR
jgi:hypothetical protein